MSSPTIRTTQEQISAVENRTKHTVSIIGCGRTGILHAILFADAEFKAICVDSDQPTVNQILRGKASFLEAETEAKLKNHVKAGCLSATSEIGEAVSHSIIIAITTPVKINSKKKPEYSDLESLCKRIGSCLQNGSVVIMLSPTGIGITEGLMRENFENTSGLKAGKDFALAYSPIQTLHTRTLEETADCRRIVAASDKDSLDVASAILKAVSRKGIIATTNVKAVEVAALVEVLRQDTHVALANETALLCEKAGVDCIEVQRISEKDSDDPSPASVIADESFSEEPYILLEELENLNLKSRQAAAARDTNEETVKHVANLAKDALKSCGKTLKRAKIAFLGASQIPNSHGPVKRTARKIVENLEARGAKTSLYDPYLSETEVAGTSFHLKKTLAEATERTDLIIIMTAHDQFTHLNLRKLKLTMKMPAAIVDLEGIAEPSKIEKEGFVYRGLGRGVWTK